LNRWERVFIKIKNKIEEAVNPREKKKKTKNISNDKRSS